MSEAVSETVQRLQLAAMFCMVGRVTLSSLSPLSVGPFWTAQRFRVRLGLSHLHAVLEGQPPYYSRDRARVSAWTTPDRLLPKTLAACKDTLFRNIVTAPLQALAS